MGTSAPGDPIVGLVIVTTGEPASMESETGGIGAVGRQYRYHGVSVSIMLSVGEGLKDLGNTQSSVFKSRPGGDTAIGGGSWWKLRVS